QEERFTLYPGQSRTLRYTLQHYTRWELADASRRIRTSLTDDELTLTIDASEYPVTGPYIAELTLTNDISTAVRRIEYNIGAESPALRLDLYPNPCTDRLYLLCERSGEATIRLRNSIGRECFRRTVLLTEETPLQLDLSQLSAGTYRFEADFEGVTVTRTVVKR
ncbi:MAG: T9SS type A sorting domain-containing protein, partial [Alistipes sp.]|nr:T9SS type A sorting domain-containing protein [Alistipes sp.]